jgi:uncharacterized protein (DUF952 family)
MIVTMHSDTLHKIQVVQAYIHHKTGKQVRIVFNRPDRMQQHLMMLDHAYLIAMGGFKNNNSNDANIGKEK